jgi:hypothetical protein
MRRDTARPIGIVLALMCAGWIAAVLAETLLAVKYRSHLTSANAWHNAFDSGVLAFPSMLALLTLMLASLAALGIGIATVVGYASLDRWGILTAAIFGVTLLLAWNGATSPTSWLEFAQLITLWIGCAGVGIATGLRLLPGRREHTE